MEIFQNYNDFKSDNALALSLGMFDGVHIGHQSIIKRLKNKALEKNMDTAIFTFWPHPRLVFNANENLNLLNTIEEKQELIQNFGIKNLILQNFNADFRNLSGEDFVRKILLKKLNVRYLIIGYDHTFGKNKSGNFDLLKKLSKELNFEVEQMEAISLKDKNVSSTKIREALHQANIKEANQMLGYQYSISGKVIHGKKIGRTIGFPTANIDFPSHKLLPKNGAYIVDVLIDKNQYKGMLSVGTNPTVNGKNTSVEVHILNFNRDIYGENIIVKFRDFIHDEIKFNSLEELVERLNQDKIITENYAF